MGGYSKEDRDEFKAKDRRISRLATIRDCISKLGDFDELLARKQEVTEVSEYLVQYVYNGLENGAASSDVATGTEEAINWEEVAGYGGLAIPNEVNVKILNLIIDELRKADKAVPTPTELLTHIIDRFGSYPTNKVSVDKVVKSLN